MTRGSFTKRLLSRFTFSFIIIAAFLLWEARKAGDRAPIYYIGAAALFSLAIAGFRERHRSD